MKISVITVVYNAAATIGDALNSVASQSYSDIEHIVIDGGSKDGTLAIIEAHRNSIARVLSEPDGGIYHAMNKGLSLATGEIVGFLNADDMYMHEGVLAEVAEQFNEPTVDACYADLVYVDPKRTGQILRYWTSQPYRPGLFERGWMPAHPTFYVRRAVYERFGGFDLDFKLQSDFELAMRLLRMHGIRAIYVPHIWIRMRMGGATNQSISNVIKGNLEAYRACKKHNLPVSRAFIFQKVFSRLTQFFKKPSNVSTGTHTAGSRK